MILKSKVHDGAFNLKTHLWTGLLQIQRTLQTVLLLKAKKNLPIESILALVCIIVYLLLCMYVHNVTLTVMLLWTHLLWQEGE